MIWFDRELNKIKKRSLPLEWVDDMKTPSGRIHVGSLRGVLVHDLIYKTLTENGIRAHFSYVFNDMDEMKAIPSYLDNKKWGIYTAKPLYKIPSPEKGYKSYADFYANEFINVFNSLNCHPKIIWSHKLYESGKMNEVIKTILDNSDVVRDIYKQIAKAERKPDWIPFSPICEKCGNIGTTTTYKWDGSLIHYRCEKSMVKWAVGCGYEGKKSPYNGSGKLPWRLDWPAHWKVIGVTIESSGKDHMSSGGSYDMGVHICKEILKTEAPYAMGGYEWFTVGGRKMSSSKGVGTSAKEVTEILPPSVFRFFMVRTPINTHLDFNPYGDTIPNLFDEYDRCLSAFYDQSERKTTSGKAGEVLLDFARIMELSQVSPYPDKRPFLPRFRTVTNLLSSGKNPKIHFEKQLKRSLTPDESNILNERITYAKIYLEKYAVTDNITGISHKEGILLNQKQHSFINALINKLTQIKSSGSESVQDSVFTVIKESGLAPKDAFSILYRILTQKEYGPKAVDLILKLGIDKAVELLKAGTEKTGGTETETKPALPTIQDRRLFTIDKQVKKSYPTISVGIAVIKNVRITKQNEELDRQIQSFIQSQQHLTNDIISSYTEVLSYRKLYKQMGVDWHSRRPSPEALLRRIAQKKPLYSVNSCVDAYNSVVMKRRVSVGAFDFKEIHFPTVLKFPSEKDEILLLGDIEATRYKPSELAYFDTLGGYNIDFNYRDAQRTKVTELTTDLFINVDGVYDIDRSKVERSLTEAVEMILKYCGGTVEIMGIVV